MRARPGGDTPARGIGRGPGRLLIAVYLLFAIAASARAGYQLVAKFGEAPVAYLLSALAAAIYIVATVGLARGGRGGRRTATLCCTVELLGVLAVGTISLLDPALFPDDTVWSGFGRGYGYVPLVLPVLGLLWLRRTRPRPGPASD
ncbi:hypothetical protein [Plantactinospora sp. GCM10030261]|uniref:hypothetical protein n=1 Tax=Plantactinospora sp. GCM10030261 TaxID=3273420 RepID=UPI00360F1F1D